MPPVAAPPRTREQLSAAEARRVALAAQGLARARPPGRRSAGAAHHGRPPRGDPDRLGQRPRPRPLPAALQPPRPVRPPTCSTGSSHCAPRRLFEYWGHEASLLPVAPAAACCAGGWSARAHEAWGGMRAGRTASGRSSRAGARGRARPRAARRARPRAPRSAARQSGPWWDWSDVKRALEFLFWSGRGDVGARRRGFERLYDVPERVLPRAVIETPDAAGRRRPARARARSRRARSASRPSATCATTSGCRPPTRAPRVAELVEAGELLPVDVEGWGEPAYLHAGRALPRRRRARARSSARSTR